VGVILAVANDVPYADKDSFSRSCRRGCTAPYWRRPCAPLAHFPGKAAPLLSLLFVPNSRRLDLWCRSLCAGHREASATQIPCASGFFPKPKVSCCSVQRSVDRRTKKTTKAMPHQDSAPIFREAWISCAELAALVVLIYHIDFMFGLRGWAAARRLSCRGPLLCP